MRKILAAAVVLIVTITVGLPALVNSLAPDKNKPAVTIVKMYSHKDGKIHKIPLEDYLVGVVAAEMPAKFPGEALKAQAVAARTYVLKRLSAGGVVNSAHPGADVCDDHRHSQAWISKEEMKKRWGVIDYYPYYYKIKNAVTDTSGLVITYNGSMIDPVYHSSCGGKGTENSEDVWKFKIPYLRSVACPYDNPVQTRRTVQLSLAEAGHKAGVELTAVPASTGGKLISVAEQTSTNRPKAYLVGDKKIPAVELRELWGLRSTDFTWKIEKDQLSITTTGYGHGVGLCQYGAKGYAEKGKNFKEILTHYYTGVEIKKIN